MRTRILSLLLFPWLAFAQLDSNSVTVSATRTASLQPDQVVIGVAVDSPLATSLTDVVAAVQGVGITLSNFSGVSTPFRGPQQAPVLEWTFLLTAPLEKINDRITALNTLTQNIGKNNSGLTLMFQLQGTQISQQLAQAQTCPIADLLSDARTQAQKLASGAGMNAGPILAMSSFVSTTLPSSIAYSGIGSFLLAPTALPNCSVTVKFALK